MESPSSVLAKVSIISLILLSFPLIPLGPPSASAQSETIVKVWSQDYESSNIVDPSLTSGTSFVVDIIAFELPPIVSDTSGGVNAYDITINYDFTILNASDVDHRAPLCLPFQIGPCLFDLDNSFPLVEKINNTIGKVQLSVILLNIPPHGRVEGTGTLLSINFTVIGSAFRTIDFDETVSVITGPTDSTFLPVPYTAIDGNFENRPPFRISVNPSSDLVIPGSAVSIDVTIAQVWTVQDFTESIKLADGPLPPDTLVSYNPSEGTLPFTSRATFATSLTTPNGNYDIAIVGTSDVTNVQVQAAFTLTVGVGTGADVAVKSVLAAPAVANPGQAVAITVTVGNDGGFSISFQVNAYVSISTGSIQVGSEQVTGLSPGQTKQATISWLTNELSPGVYSVRAEVPALEGEQDLSDNTLTGNIVRLNAPPSPDFSLSAASPQAGSMVSFDGSSSFDSDGTPSTYSWDFGDGKTGTGPQVSHTYSSPGDYNVKLTIVDNDGATRTITKIVTVSAPVARAPGLFPPIWSALIGAVTIIIIVSTIFFLRARRKPREQ